MAGIYFSWSGTETILHAYVRACGNVQVLGFIQVSIVIYLALGYHHEASGATALQGEASITIRVKIGFFSRSFRLTYSQTIHGSQTSEASIAPLPSPFLVAATSAFDRELAQQLWAETHDSNPACALDAGDQSAVQGPLRFHQAMTEEHFHCYWRAFDYCLMQPCTKPAKRPLQPSKHLQNRRR